MRQTHRLVICVFLVSAGVIGLAMAANARAQRGGGPSADSNLPDSPEAVALPTVTGEVTGPGAMFESVQSLPPGKDLAHFGYEVVEHLVSGVANGQPYTTRIVVRRPADDTRFSGLVVTEAMHPSGSAHIFEYTSNYLMDSGHAAVEIGIGGVDQLIEFNEARYGDIRVSSEQAPEVLAQVGALIKEGGGDSPLAGLPLRKVVLAGTSATAAVLIQYLPAHMVYRTPGMQPIYDGFLPHGTGATIRQIDAPLIQVPTMTEVIAGNATARQDGDAPGDQFRLYEFAGMAHVDTRDSVRFKPDPCEHPISLFPLQAYLSVALDHLFQWVDAGVVPPRASRIVVDRDVANDGSVMALDENGNPIGGVRNPYVDVPVAQYGVRNDGAEPLIPNPSAWIAARGQAGADQMCRLSGYQLAFSEEKLSDLYSDGETYRRQVERRLDELEEAGWSLPVYREMILGDASSVAF